MPEVLPMSDDSLTCALLVIGAGMTAAGRAAEMGARVIVIEKAASIGGPAALSLGYLWTATSAGQLSYQDNGDPRLHRVVTDSCKRVRGVGGGRSCINVSGL